MILPCEHSARLGTHLHICSIRSGQGAQFVSRATYSLRVLVVRDTVVVHPLLPTARYICISDRHYTSMVACFGDMHYYTCMIARFGDRHQPLFVFHVYSKSRSIDAEDLHQFRMQRIGATQTCTYATYIYITYPVWRRDRFGLHPVRQMP